MLRTDLNIQPLETEQDLSDLPDFRLRQMLEAGHAFLDCQVQLRAQGRSILQELSDASMSPLSHYPRGDVYDSRSHSQFYFHNHRDGEAGHFHTFLRPLGMPKGIEPADDDAERPPGDNDALSHLVAISVDRKGEPVQMFTTNRWVTAETWYRAEDVIAMLPCFKVEHDYPSAILNRWMTALMSLFRPQAELLLLARDATIKRLSHRLPGIPVLEDRELEVTSFMAIDVPAQIAQLMALAE